MIELAVGSGGRMLRATVSPVAASLRRLRVDGTDLVQATLARQPELSAGAVLVPWPNRVADATWLLHGVPQRLAVTEPALGHALHGLLATRVYDVACADDRSVVLRAEIADEPGYPFRLATSVRYELVGDGIDVEHELRNVGDGVAPVAIGAHPYLRLGGEPILGLTLTIPATEALELDVQRHLPGRRLAVEGTPYDLRDGLPVSRIVPHAAYTALASRRGRIEHRLTAADGRSTVIWADPVFRWVQVWLTDGFPGAPGGHALAVEPMTAPPDALNSGEDLRWLRSGEHWRARWGIRLSGAPAGRDTPD
ncbi:aldose epimerase family protein [Agromyces bauzanensis]